MVESKKGRWFKMKARLTERDIKLMYFLGRYKQIKAIDCKKIYKSKDYYLKRLKALEKAKYVKREKRCIKIDSRIVDEN